MCISQECFNEARCLHHLIYRKMINSLTWDVRFSLISNNLLTFWLSGIFVAITPMYPGSPFDSSEQILRAYLRGCLWGLSLQRVHWVKYYSQLLDCAFFSVKRGTLRMPRMANSGGLEIHPRIPISPPEHYDPSFSHSKPASNPSNPWQWTHIL